MKFFRNRTVGLKKSAGNSENLLILIISTITARTRAITIAGSYISKKAHTAYAAASKEKRAESFLSLGIIKEYGAPLHRLKRNMCNLSKSYSVPGTKRCRNPKKSASDIKIREFS